MKPHNEERKVAEGRNKPVKLRFRIERLEERIAPAKGGIPGAPQYHYPPGQNDSCPPGWKPGGWGGCCKGGYCPI